MVIMVKDGNLTVSKELEEDGFSMFVSCEEMLIAAYDVISRIFSEESVIKAYYATDPATMSLRTKREEGTEGMGRQDREVTER